MISSRKGKIIISKELYDIYDTCIQKVYDLSFDDFKVLEVLIAGTVEQYLTAKGLDNARSRI